PSTAIDESYGAYVVTTATHNDTNVTSVSTYVKGLAIPAAARPADALTSISQIADLQALRTINVGEVIATSQFGAAGTLSASTSGLTIPAGRNAITVTSPVPQAVAGFVSAGDLVNIYLTTKIGDPRARLLLSNVTRRSPTTASTSRNCS